MERPFDKSEPCRNIPTLTVDAVAEALRSEDRIINPSVELTCGRSPLRKTDDAVGPSTVQIINRRKVNGDPIVATGSGFFYSKDDTVVTNAHVVANSKTLTVQMPTGERFAGRIVKLDDINDLAVIKIDDLRPDPSRTLTEADMNKLNQHDPVIGVGHPGGMESNVLSQGELWARTSLYNSVSDRVQHSISAAAADFIAARPSQAKDVADYLAAPRLVAKLPIWPGNSGGPVVNTANQLVGVAQAMDTAYPGVALLVPADKVRDLFTKSSSKFAFNYEKTSTFSEKPLDTAITDIGKAALTAYIPRVAAVYWGVKSLEELVPSASLLIDQKTYGNRSKYALNVAESAVGISGSLLTISSKVRPVGYALMGAKVLWSISHDFERNQYQLKGYKRLDGQKQEPYGWTDSIDEHMPR